MPIALLRSYCTMAGRLAAEESLRLATAVGVGTGSARNADDIVRSWRDAAASLSIRRPRDLAQLASRAAGAGIRLQVRRTRPTDGG